MGAGSAGLTAAGRRFVVAGLVAALGAAAIVGVNADLSSRDARARDRAQAGVAGALSSRFTNVGKRVDQYAALLSRTSHQRIESRLVGAPRTDITSVGVLGKAVGSAATGKLSHVSSTERTGSQSLAGAVRAPAVVSAASIARDSGDPIAAIVDAPAGATLVVAWPLYAGEVPENTAARRSQSVGWVVGASRVADLVSPALRAFEPLGITSAVDVGTAGPGPVQSIAAGATPVRVMHFARQSRLPLVLIGVLAGMAFLCLCALAVARRRADRLAEIHERDLTQRMRLLSDIGVTVQESLEIGVVLPAALTQISLAHSLSYISVVTGAGNAERSHVLSIGRLPAAVPGQRWSPGANSATAGQLVRLPLQRASRTLGYVEIVPAKTLNKDELASLRSTTDLLANALHNAEMYEREQETVRRLRDLDEMKDDFLSTVSHELRTPLSVLVGFMSLLARKWDRLSEEDRREAVVKMQTHVTSLAHLVNDLLDFVSERRNRESMPAEVTLNREVSAVVEQLRPLCERQELELQLSEDVPAWTDARAVERIIGNLVSNAAKYSPAGSTIWVATHARDDTAVVTVTDQGPGIGPEERQRIFERFYRGESDAARSTRGSGIGLAVVHEWLVAVGARLDIASEPGNGTSISVHFPARPGAVVAQAGTVRWTEPAIALRSVSHEPA